MNNQLKNYLPGFGRIFSYVVPVILVFVFGKISSTDELGKLNYVVSLITLINVFTDFGLSEMVQRFLPIELGKENRIISAGLALEFFITFLAAVTLTVVDFATGYALTGGYTLLFAITIFFSTSNLVVLIFNGLGKSWYTSTYFFAMGFLQLVIPIVLATVLQTPAVEAFFIGRIIGFGLLTIVPILQLISLKLVKPVFQISRREIRFAVNSLCITFSYTAFSQWDSILVTAAFGLSANGVYKSISLLGSASYMFSTIIQTKLLPEFSGLFRQQESTILLKRHKKNILSLIGICSVIFVFALLFKSEFVTMFFNSEISNAGAYLLPIIFVGASLYVFAIPSVAVLQSVGKENQARNFSIMQSTGFILLSGLLAPTIGLIFIPVALIISNLIFFVIIYIKAVGTLKTFRW